MDWITGMQRAIDYIENHITEPLDYERIAIEGFSSSYHFQRLFSLVCGYTLGEYIRNRRLTLAGAELRSESARIVDVALKYGYESPDGFAKAFRQFHGVLPSQARSDGAMLKSFSRLHIEVIMKGGTTMNYRMEEKEAFTLIGHRLLCTGSPTNAENAHTQTQKHWECAIQQRKCMKSLRYEDSVWYDVYTDFSEEGFSHLIAVKGESNAESELETITISAHLYAVFETERGHSPDDEWAGLMRRIISEWLPTSRYTIAEHPQVNKLYFDKDPSKRYMEVWLPVEEK